MPLKAYYGILSVIIDLHPRLHMSSYFQFEIGKQTVEFYRRKLTLSFVSHMIQHLICSALAHVSSSRIA